MNAPPGSSKPRKRSASSRCAVDDTGRNSVSPCTTPSSAAASRSTPRDYDERRAVAALTFTGAAAAAPAPLRLPRMMAIAAAMNTVE